MSETEKAKASALITNEALLKECLLSDEALNSGSNHKTVVSIGASDKPFSVITSSQQGPYSHSPGIQEQYRLSGDHHKVDEEILLSAEIYNRLTGRHPSRAYILRAASYARSQDRQSFIPLCDLFITLAENPEKPGTLEIEEAGGINPVRQFMLKFNFNEQAHVDYQQEVIEKFLSLQNFALKQAEDIMNTDGVEYEKRNLPLQEPS